MFPRNTDPVPQRPWGLDWQDDPAFADFSSDFDPRWRAAPPRLRGVGRNLG
jgi:hypothetical protein